jgi:hypothetical protein
VSRSPSVPFASLLLLSSLLLPSPTHAADLRGSGPHGVDLQNVSALDEAGPQIGLTTVDVNCDEGETLAKALRRRADRLVIEIRGTCNEDVVIRRDDLTLTSTTAGTTLVGGVHIESSQRVEVSGFTITDNVNFESGLEAVAGSSVLIRDMLVKDSAIRGIRIRDSVAEITDTTVRNSGSTGIIGRGSRLTFNGVVESTNNFESAFVFTDATSVFSKEGDLIGTFSDNGMIVQTGSSFEGPFGSLTVTHNDFSGVLVATQGKFVYGFDLVSEANGFAGIWLDESSSMSPFSNIGHESTTTLQNNGVVGAFLQRGSTLEFGGTTTVTGQLFGVFSEESLLRTNNADITGNVRDVHLQHRSIANFESGNSVGSVECDGTDLVRGEFSCASPLSSLRSDSSQTGTAAIEVPSFTVPSRPRQ